MEDILTSFGQRIRGQEGPVKKQELEAFFKDYYVPIDKECFIAVMSEYEKNVPTGFKPEYYKESYARYGSVQDWADEMFGTTVFTDKEKVDKLTATAAADPESAKLAVESDPAAVLFN